MGTTNKTTFQIMEEARRSNEQKLDDLLLAAIYFEAGTNAINDAVETLRTKGNRPEVDIKIEIALFAIQKGLLKIEPKKEGE